MLALPAKREADGLPLKFDREVDFEISRRLICFRPSSGPIEIRREMRADERAAVDARAAALELALRPFAEDGRAGLKASIGAMLGGFRSMRQQGDDVDAIVSITLAVLRDFPAWAITAACLKIAQRETKCDPRFAPNDAEIADVVRSLVKPYREALEAASTLVGAVVQSDEVRQRSSTRENQQPPPSVSDGKHAQRIAADLAERKARNAESRHA